MSDTPTPRTDEMIFKLRSAPTTGRWSARMRDFARELERELATENAINQRNCEDWAEDHTRLQKLCIAAGITEATVYGDRNYVPGIVCLAEMLADKLAGVMDELKCSMSFECVRAKVAERTAELERENTRLSEGFAPAINAIEVKACANEEAASRATEAMDIAWSQGVAAGLRLALSVLPNAV